ncbi:MAG: hypothetical protein K2Q01_05300, partial [Rickettsiales bacterium]|nr:hypothetical protein [Rickettsiales bacterium]
FLSSFALILWNEYRTVEEVWRLNEGSRLVVSLESDQPDSDTNGQLIHMSGKVNTKDMLSDEVFYISANAVKMARFVEMYQWSEEKTAAEGAPDKQGLGYVKIWSQKPIDSTKFRQQQGHVNPPMELFSSEYVAGNVNVGGFVLTPPFIAYLNDYQDFPMTQETYAQINPEMAEFVLHKGEFYKGPNPEVPEVGDVRVHYQLVHAGKEVSVIGMQNVDKIDTYHTDYSAIKLLTEGTVDADTMLRREVKARDAGVIWQLRFGGWFVMLVSIGMALYSFCILAPVLPLVGGLVGYNNFEMSFFLSLAFTLMTVAMAWIAYRPALATGLLVLGASLIILSTFLKKKSAKQLQKAANKSQARAARKAERKAVKEAAKGQKDIPAGVKFMKAGKNTPAE